MRAVLLNDLGAALARLAEVDAACAAFMQSLDLADQTGAVVHAQRGAGAAAISTGGAVHPRWWRSTSGSVR